MYTYTSPCVWATVTVLLYEYKFAELANVIYVSILIHNTRVHMCQCADDVRWGPHPKGGFAANI